MHPQIDVHEWIFISLYWYTIKIKIPHYSTVFRCISRGSVQFGMAYRSELQVCVFLKWQFQRNLFVLFVIYSLEAECMYSLSQHGAQNRPHFDSCAFNRLTWLAKSISLVRCKRWFEAPFVCNFYECGPSRAKSIPFWRGGMFISESPRSLTSEHGQHGIYRGTRWVLNFKRSCLQGVSLRTSILALWLLCTNVAKYQGHASSEPNMNLQDFWLGPDKLMFRSKSSSATTFEFANFGWQGRSVCRVLQTIIKSCLINSGHIELLSDMYVKIYTYTITKSFEELTLRLH